MAETPPKKEDNVSGNTSQLIDKETFFNWFQNKIISEKDIEKKLILQDILDEIKLL